MITRVVKDGKERFRFSYPMGPRRLALFAWFVMLGLFVVLFGPLLATRPFFPASVMGLLILVLFGAVGGGFDGLLRRLVGGDDTIVGEDGLRRGRRFIPWDDIAGVKLWPCRLPLSLRFRRRREKVGFLDHDKSFSRLKRDLGVLSHPSVYRELIPAILAIRPDQELSPSVQRRLEDPERDSRFFSVLLAIAMTAELALLFAALLYGTHGLDVDGLLCAAMNFGAFSAWGFSPVTPTARQRYVRFALSAPTFAAMALALGFFIGAPLVAVRMVVVEAIAAVALGMIVRFGMKRLTRTTEVALCAALVVLPLVTLLWAAATAWPVREITGLAPVGDPWRPIWGRSDKYMSWRAPDDTSSVVQISDWTRQPVPELEGYTHVVWLDDELLVRWNQSRVDHRLHLWVYRFATGEHVDVRIGHQLRISGRRPVSPDRTMLAWIDIEEEDSQSLRVWNCEMGEDVIPPKLLQPPPEEREKAPEWEAMWVADNSVAAFCKEDMGEHDRSRLRVLHVSTVDGATEELVSPVEKGVEWTLAPDARHAFTHNRWWLRGAETGLVEFVDLATGERATLAGGGSLPAFTPDGRYGFRIVRADGRSFLGRVDPTTGRQTLPCEVDEGFVLAGLSRDGEVACLVREGMLLGWPTVVVLHVPTGRRKTIRLPASIVAASDLWFSSRTDESVVSPDGRFVLLEATVMSFMMPNGEWGLDTDDVASRYFVYAIPPDWPAD